MHLLVPAGDLPWGVLKTRCGHLLPPGGPGQPERPSAHRTCPTCADVAKRSCSVPVDRWVIPRVTPEGQPVGAGHRDTIRMTWARCSVDQRLHLLGARAVLDLAAMSCALARCGVLIITQELVLRGSGTPCPTCLAVGSA